MGFFKRFFRRLRNRLFPDNDDGILLTEPVNVSKLLGDGETLWVRADEAASKLWSGRDGPRMLSPRKEILSPPADEFDFPHADQFRPSPDAIRKAQEDKLLAQQERERAALKSLMANVKSRCRDHNWIENKACDIRVCDGGPALIDKAVALLIERGWHATNESKPLGPAWLRICLGPPG